MNNKSFYAILATLTLVSLLPITSTIIMKVIQIYLCGGAFYYVYSHIKSKRQISLMIILMGAIGLLFNPFITPPLSLPTWIPIKIMAMILFYLAAKDETIITQVSRIESQTPQDKTITDALQQGFTFIGIQTRTTNEDSQSQHDMGALWKRFHAEQVWAQIPNKCSNHIITIYTDYETNHTGAYTAMIGAMVKDNSSAPHGMIKRHFPSDHYKKFSTSGPLPESRLSLWSNIWSNEERLNRSCHCDIEVYPGSDATPDTPIHIYLSTVPPQERNV